MYGSVPFRGSLLLVFLSFFLIFTLASFFTTSRWASFNRSTWLPLGSTQTPGSLSKPFGLICDMFRLSPTPSTFLSYYTSHPTEPLSWHSFIIRSGNILFSLFTTSYKNLKGKFFKIFVDPEDTRFFFDEVGRSRFPLYWTRNPTRFKEWTRPAPSA